MTAPQIVVATMADAGTPDAPEPARSANDEMVYREGLEQLKAARYDDARAAFTDVQRRANSRYAGLAELHLADIEYAAGNFTQAATDYEAWVKKYASASRRWFEYAYSCRDSAKCRAAQPSSLCRPPPPMPEERFENP